MNNDYYQSYHQVAPGSPKQHSSGPYGRPSRTAQLSGGGPGGPPSSHGPISQAPQSALYPGVSNPSGYGRSAPAGVAPPRKLDPQAGPPPHLMRDYPPYEQLKDPYYDGKNSPNGGYPVTNRPPYQRDDLHAKYDMHPGVPSSGGYGRGVGGGDVDDQTPVSKLSSSYPPSGTGGPPMPPSARDSAMSLANPYNREHEPASLPRGSATNDRPLNAGVPSSTLEKYFTGDEIKRFNEYNRHLVMSSPGRQKKFYATLSSAEYKRFMDFVDFEQNGAGKIGGGGGGVKSSLPPPPPPPIIKMPGALPPPPPIATFEPAYASSYSAFSSSFYDEDKSVPHGVGRSDLYRAAPPSLDFPPKFGKYPELQFMTKSGIGAYELDAYERVARAAAVAAGREAELARYSRDFELSLVAGAGRAMDRGRDRERDYDKSSSSYHRSNSNSGRRHSRSRSRSRSRSPRYRSDRRSRSPHKPSGFYDRERDRDRHRENRDDRSESYSSSTHRRSHSPDSKSRSTSGRRDVSSKDYKLEPTTNTLSRQLSPRAEHRYLKNSLDKVKKIHKVKLEELEEIKRRDNDNCDSYIYKKVSSSLKDVEKTISVIEKQIQQNKLRMEPDDAAEVSNEEEEKKPKEKSKESKKNDKKETNNEKSESEKDSSKVKKKRKAENEEVVKETEAKVGSDKTDSAMVTTESAASPVISAAAAISATHANVAKLPKIPKLSKKSPTSDKAETKETKETAKKDVSVKKTSESDEVKKTFSTSTSTTKILTISKAKTTESTSVKPSSAESSSKTEVKPKTRTESISSSKSEAKPKNESTSKSSKTESSSHHSSAGFGPITEEEMNQVLPNYQFCSLCKNFFESTDEFVSHLHRDAHLNGLRSTDFAIIKRAEEKLDSNFIKEHQAEAAKKSALNGTNEDKKTLDQTNANLSNAFLGTEFLYPSKSYYCDLCAKFLYTTQQTEMHLHSEKHITLYKKYLSKNKDYETKMLNQRKQNFKFSYLMRTLIRMKDKGEDIVARITQDRAKRDRQRVREREESSVGTGPSKKQKLESQSATNDIQSLLSDLVGLVEKEVVKQKIVSPLVSTAKTEKAKPKASKQLPASKQPPVAKPTPATSVKELISKKDTTKKEASKKETAKKEVPKKETLKKEALKKEAPKKEAPKKETPKKETPKKETPKKSAKSVVEPVVVDTPRVLRSTRSSVKATNVVMPVVTAVSATKATNGKSKTNKKTNNGLQDKVVEPKEEIPEQTNGADEDEDEVEEEEEDSSGETIIEDDDEDDEEEEYEEVPQEDDIEVVETVAKKGKQTSRADSVEEEDQGEEEEEDDEEDEGTEDDADGFDVIDETA